MCEFFGRNRSNVAMLVVAASITLTAIACGGDGGGGGQRVSTPQGLWVPNSLTSLVTEFIASQRTSSGSPAAHRTNASDGLDQPNAAIFDKSNNLWVSNCTNPSINNTGAGTIMEFTTAQLKNLGSQPAPTPHATIQDDGTFSTFDCPYGMQFDSHGNMWVANRFNQDLVEFTPNQLKSAGVQLPNTEFTYSGFGDPESLSFDKSKNLWITDVSQNVVEAYTSATLATIEGTTESFVTPDIINSSAALSGPTAIAFDKSGNQWVANCFSNELTRFAKSDISANGSPTPDVVLSSTSVTVPASSTFSLFCPNGLAFDSSGNLWVANLASDTLGSIAEFTPSQLSASGSPVPHVFLDADSGGVNMAEPALITFGPNI